MINDNNSKDLTRTLVSDRLKAKRKMLGINYQEITDNLDITEKEIKRVENPTFPDLGTISDNIAKISGIKKYLIEISDPTRNRLAFRELDLFEFDEIGLLFEELKSSYDYVIEFSGHIKPGQELYDEIDNVSYEDNNILEITNIKKVKNNL